MSSQGLGLVESLNDLRHINGKTQTAYSNTAVSVTFTREKKSICRYKKEIETTNPCLSGYMYRPVLIDAPCHALMVTQHKQRADGFISEVHHSEPGEVLGSYKRVR